MAICSCLAVTKYLHVAFQRAGFLLQLKLYLEESFLTTKSKVQPLWEFKWFSRIHMSPITCIYLFGLFFNKCFCRAWWLPMTNNSLTHILQLRASWLFCSPIEVYVCFLYYNEMTVTIIPTLCQHFIKHKLNLLLFYFILQIIIICLFSLLI